MDGGWEGAVTMCDSEASFLCVHSSQKVSQHEAAINLKFLSIEVDFDNKDVIRQVFIKRSTENFSLQYFLNWQSMNKETL